MNREQTRGALSHALQRWEDEPAGTDPSPTLRHVEVFAIASLAQELHAIAQTLQARHEEAIERGREHITQAGAPQLGCRASHGPGPLVRCTRPLGHAGEHVDAAGERWGGEHG